MPEQGFTIIELLVVIAIAAILLTLVAPNFAGLLFRAELQQYAQHLHDDMAYARQYAHNRGRVLSFCTPVCYQGDDQREGWLILDGQQLISQRSSDPVQLRLGDLPRYTKLYIHPNGLLIDTHGQEFASTGLLCHRLSGLGFALRVYHGGVLRYDDTEAAVSC